MASLSIALTMLVNEYPEANIEGETTVVISSMYAGVVVVAVAVAVVVVVVVVDASLADVLRVFCGCVVGVLPMLMTDFSLRLDIRARCCVTASLRASSRRATSCWILSPSSTW